MLRVKLEETTELDFYRKNGLNGKRSSNDEDFSLQSKYSFKDYVDEIFAGLIWLG